MGISGPGCGAGQRGWISLSTVARVVPALPSFAVDDGFRYRVPADLDVSVGSIVRVPLSGRKVRGYVVDVEAGDADGLADVRSVSGAWPAFAPPMRDTARWIATHYVAPFSVVLSKTAPPNLPRRAGARSLPSIPPASSPLPGLTAAAAAGDTHRPAQVLSGSGWDQLVRGLITDVIRSGRSAVVVAPTVVEVSRMADALGGDFGGRVIEVGDQSDATVTTAWSVATAQGGLVVVGTPRVLWWPVSDLSMIVLLEAGRRSMKERQTPTVSAAVLARRRSQLERCALVHVGRTPTVDALADGLVMHRTPGRLWSPVEVVDRSEEPPGGGVVTERAKVAVAAATRAGRRSLVFTHRRGYAPASRCTQCRLLRACPECGSRPDPGTNCARCGAPLGPCPACGSRRFEPLGAAYGRVLEELRRVVGRDAGAVDDSRLVTVATERDLVRLDGVDLAVVVDADGLIRGTNYRATEDALGLLARVAGLVSAGDGRRTMVQTADPEHPVHAALRRSDPLSFLQDEMLTRRDLGLPPAGDVIVVEVRDAADVGPLVEALDSVTTFGPVEIGDRSRWLVQGADLDPIRRPLARAVAKLRDRGATVRIDVDPRDL